MLTKEDFINNFKEALEGSGYEFNEANLDRAIKFMFRVYATASEVKANAHDEGENLSLIDVKLMIRDDLNTLLKTGQFEDPFVEGAIEMGFANNLDEIHEGGPDSSIGAIIIKKERSGSLHKKVEGILKEAFNNLLYYEVTDDAKATKRFYAVDVHVRYDTIGQGEAYDFFEEEGRHVGYAYVPAKYVEPFLEYVAGVLRKKHLYKGLYICGIPLKHCREIPVETGCIRRVFFSSEAANETAVAI